VILSALRDAPEPLTEEEVDHRVNGRTGRKRAALRRLVSRDAVVRSGKGVRGDGYRYSVPRAGTSDSGFSFPCSLVPLRTTEQETINSGLSSPTLVPCSPVPEGPPTGGGGSVEAEPASANEDGRDRQKDPQSPGGNDSDT
jgi:hypothetical protein